MSAMETAMNARKNALNPPLAALALLAAAALAPSAAVAATPYDYGHATREHQKTQAHFTEKLREAEMAVVEALRQATGQLSGNLKEQMAGEASIADLQDKRAVQQKIEEARLQATVQAASGASTCNVITGAVGGQDLESQVAQWREQVIQAQVEWDAGEIGASRLGSRAAMEKRVDTHCKLYASEADVASGACSVAVSKENAGKDLNANTLLGAQNGVLSAQDADAAVLFLSTALNPRPLGGLPKEIGKTENGRRLIAERQASLARASVATTIGTMLAANRVAFDQQVVGDSGGTAEERSQGLRDWAEGTAKQTLGYSDQGDNFPNGVSKNAWLELRAKAWFLNPNWAIRVDSQTVDQTAKDIAMMEAFQTYQNWEQYRLLEQINLSLATMLSILEGRERERL